MSSSGFPGSFFTNDPVVQIRNNSTASSFDFGLQDTEKARKELTDTQHDSPMEIRPYSLESGKYSAHSLSFGTSKNVSKTPVMVALPTTNLTSAAIIKALNKGNNKVLPWIKVNSEPRTMNYTSCTKNDDSKKVISGEKERTLIQPPPEAHLQTPSKEIRLRKQTPSLLTQATGVSTNSASQAVITHASKGPVLCATARTVTTSTIYSKRAPSPVDTVMPHENNPSIDLGATARFSVYPDSYERV